VCNVRRQNLRRVDLEEKASSIKKLVFLNSLFFNLFTLKKLEDFVII